MIKPLANFAAKLTGPRYEVVAGRDFEWSSKSWTHNVFRVFELVFGRKYGIRAEATVTSDGLVFIHTFEAAIAFTETAIREFFTLPKFKLVKVYIPQLAPAGFGHPQNTPYLFAVAFDAASTGDASSTTSVTFSHTCTGSNLTLVIGGLANAASPSLSGATYNAVSATAGVHNTDTSNGFDQSIFYLANPATGANNIVISATSSTALDGYGISLTGTAASPSGASATVAVTSSTTPSVSVTTTAANSWVVDSVIRAALGTDTESTTGTNQTSRAAVRNAGANAKLIGSTETTTATGSYTLSWTINPSRSWQCAALEIKALVVAASGSPTMLMMGI